MEFKELIFKFRICYSFLPTKLLLKMAGKKVILPFYHTAIGGEINFVNHLYNAKSEREFEQDLDYLLKYFKPINIKTLVKIKSGEIKNPDPCFFLSFDDGLSKFYLFIAPLLLKYNVPATVFLNSDFVNNQALFYRYKVNLLIDKVLKIELTEKLQNEISKVIKTTKINKYDFIKWLKNCTHFNNFELDKIAILLKVSFKDFLVKEKPYLSSQQIKELITKGFTFGAHSCSHPRYDLIDFENQLCETKDSIHFVTKTFNLEQKLFSFPFSDVGVSKLFFKEMEKNNIYSFGTSGLKDENLDFHLQRIPMEYSSKYSAKTIIKGELFYYILKRFINRNKIKRN
tara:strand:+ start:1859 stop:2884 length:1026 start_codon:yes stop_codon:yes gene_type:complete